MPMTGPRVVLAGLSLITGLLNAPQFGGGLVEKWVFFEEIERITFDYPLAAISVVGGLIGLVGSHALLTAETGWTPRIPLEQTVDDLLAWWRSQ